MFCLKGEGGPRAILNVYVDDLLFLGEAELYDVVLKQLQERYDITSTGKEDDLIVWNGLEIQRLSDGRIKVTQVAKIREMAREYARQLGRLKAKPSRLNLAKGICSIPGKPLISRPRTSDNLIHCTCINGWSAARCT